MLICVFVFTKHIKDRYDYCLILRSNSQIHDVKLSTKPKLEQTKRQIVQNHYDLITEKYFVKTKNNNNTFFLKF